MPNRRMPEIPGGSSLLDREPPPLPGHSSRDRPPPPIPVEDRSRDSQPIGGSVQDKIAQMNFRPEVPTKPKGPIRPPGAVSVFPTNPSQLSPVKMSPTSPVGPRPPAKTGRSDSHCDMPSTQPPPLPGGRKKVLIFHSHLNEYGN